MTWFQQYVHSGVFFAELTRIASQKYLERFRCRKGGAKLKGSRSFRKRPAMGADVAVKRERGGGGGFLPYSQGFERCWLHVAKACCYGVHLR